MQKKLPTSISTEDLLKSLDENNDPVEVIQNDFLKFIRYFNIEAGDHLVPTKAMYQLYKRWTANPMSRQEFGHQMSNLFMRSVPCNAYRLNKDAFNLSQKAYELLIAKKRDKLKSKVSAKHFERFLKHYNLTEGDFWVESFVLENLYDEWTFFENRKKRLLSTLYFIKFLNLYFKKQRRTENRVGWYGINKEAKQFLTKERLKTLRKVHEIKAAKKKKPTFQK